MNRGGYLNPDPESGNSTGVTLTARSIDPKTSVRSYATNAYLEPVLCVPSSDYDLNLAYDNNPLWQTGTAKIFWS
jgi:hypothetical protein